MLLTKKGNITKLNIHAKDMGKDIDDIVLDKLKNKYKGKCYNSALIMDISKITNRSQIEISKSRNDGSGDLSVEYESSIFIYEKGDIISGCEIKKISENGIIICSSLYATIYIQITMQKTLLGLKDGNILPVIVTGVTYTTGQPKITVSAIPYTSSNEIIAYKPANTVLDLEQIEIIRLMIQTIDKEIELFETVKENDKTNFKYFTQMFYPFKKPFSEYRKGKLPKGWDYLDIYETCVGYVGRIKNSDKKTDKKSKEDSSEESPKISKTPKTPKTKKKDSKDSKSPKTPKKERKKGKGVSDLSDIFSNVYLLRHLIIDRQTPYVFSVSEDAFKKGDSDLLDSKTYDVRSETLPLATIICKLLSDYYNYIKLIRESCEFYDTDKMKSDHKALWKLYE